MQLFIQQNRLAWLARSGLVCCLWAAALSGASAQPQPLTLGDLEELDQFNSRRLERFLNREDRLLEQRIRNQQTRRLEQIESFRNRALQQQQAQATQQLQEFARQRYAAPQPPTVTTPAALSYFQLAQPRLQRPPTTGGAFPYVFQPPARTAVTETARTVAPWRPATGRSEIEQRLRFIERVVGVTSTATEAIAATRRRSVATPLRWPTEPVVKLPTNFDPRWYENSASGGQTLEDQTLGDWQPSQTPSSAPK